MTEQTQQGPASEAQPTGSEQPAAPLKATPIPADDALGGLLSEFDRQTAQKPAAQPQPRVEHSREDLESFIKSEEAMNAPLPRRQLFDGMTSQFNPREQPSEEGVFKAEFEAMKERMSALDQRELMQQRAQLDRETGIGILREHAETLGSLNNLPPDTVPLRLAAEEKLNPELRDALARRFDSPEAWHKAIAVTRKVAEKIIRQAAEENWRRDPEHALITEDRALVSAAVRGSAQSPPPAPKVDVSKLSDRDLAKHVESSWGYRPKFAGG